MKHTVLWLVGSPGVGKTTLVRALLGEKRTLIASPKWTLTDEYIAAGWYTGQPFDGADTVPYNGAAAALDFWQQKLLRRGAPVTILDGDRFSNATALAFFRQQAELARPPVSIELRCLYASMNEASEESRRKSRGAEQNASWVKGRRTKALNFYTAFEGTKLKLDFEGFTAAELAHTTVAWLKE